MTPIEELELANVDDDIAAIFRLKGTGCFKLGFPTELQLVRNIKELNHNLVALIEYIEHSDYCTDYSGEANSAIEPKDFSG